MRVIRLLLVSLIFFQTPLLFGKGQFSQLIEEERFEEAQNHILIKFSKRHSHSQKPAKEDSLLFDQYLFVKAFKILFKELPMEKAQKEEEVKKRYKKISALFLLSSKSEKLDECKKRENLSKFSCLFLNLNNSLTAFGIRNLASPELVASLTNYFQGVGEAPIANLNNLRDSRAIEKTIKAAWEIWSNNSPIPLLN